ncbi:MAG: DegT/DnrJ/EryC1/StrS family aminotransferase [Lentisphaeria bacterium]|nr:DegT/DnrJ/EryC1/StrS family aminotransferase [Lentisphaeria bacterium]
MSILAINGGKAEYNASDWNSSNKATLWPVYTSEDENAILEVLRNRQMSGSEITKKFEKAYAEYVGAKHVLGYCSGTASLHAAMWACGVGAGDEVIAPSLTYWATCAAAISLGAAVNFADIDPVTLCIDPKDIEHRIGPRTKAIIVVHYLGHPADMDEIMAIARKHNVKVIEDASHSHACLYKGTMTGTIGDIAGQSMMTGKSFALGEAGVIITNNRDLYERCISYGHYERTGVANNFNSSERFITDPELIHFAGVPIGGRKDRMNQWCSALGLVQLKYFPERVAKIEEAMQYLCDEMDKLPGLCTHRPAKGSGTTKGAWYSSACHYNPEELDGLSLDKFIAAMVAENLPVGPLGNFPLHLHPVFNEADVFFQGKPTALAFGQRDVRQGKGALPVAEAARSRVFRFSRFVSLEYKNEIDRFVATIKKVIDNRGELLK